MKIVEIQCYYAGCGHSPFPMAEKFYERARRTHELWTCPAGHQQKFVGETQEEKEIKELKQSVIWLRRDNKYLRKDRLSVSRTCPWPNCEFVASSGSSWDRRPLWSHMRAIHEMPALYQILEEARLMEDKEQL